jgi:hypothetical protein
MSSNNHFNDKMMTRAMLPLMYLWIVLAGGIVGLGFVEPFVFKTTLIIDNVDKFIALLGIVTVAVSPVFATILRMWEAEQTGELAEMPVQAEHERVRDAEEHAHVIQMESRLERPWGANSEE